MKLKVHAQRKFAQGAFIPPSASAAAPERRGDVTPSKEDHRNVYYNRMSAVSLLDIVAFQNMHSHTEPVVLLERLEELTDSQPAADVNGTLTTPPKNGSATSNGTRLAKTKPTRPLRYIRPKRTGGLNQRAQRPQRPQSMHLRSRLGTTFKPKARAVGKKRVALPTARAARRVPSPSRRRVPSPAESYDLDDDKPLTFIAQALRRTHTRLRKRRGEEIVSTSKLPPKASQASDSDDDTDASTANGPPKPKSLVKPTNGTRINEGAGTSKQSDAPSRRELAVRLTDASRTSTSSPRSVTSSDVSTRSLKPPSGSSRVLLKTKRVSRNLNGTPANAKLARPMGESKTKLNKIKRARTAAQNKMLLESRTGLRAQRRINKEHNLRASRPKLETQTSVREMRSISAQKSVQNDDHNVKSPLPNQIATQQQKESDNQAQKITQIIALHCESAQTQPKNSHDEHKQKNPSDGLPSRNNDHKLRSSSRPSQTANVHKVKAVSRPPSAFRNSNTDIKNSTQSQPNQNNNHKLRSSVRPQLLNQTNDHKLRSGSRGQSTSQSDIDPDDRQKEKSMNETNDPKVSDNQKGPSTSQSNDSTINTMPSPSSSQTSSAISANSVSVPPMNSSNDNIRSNTRPKMRSDIHRGTRVLLASKNNPYYLKNNSRYDSLTHGSRYPGGGGRAGPSSHNRNPTTSSVSQTQASLQINNDPGPSSRAAPSSQSNAPASSIQLQPTQANDVVRSFLQTPTTSRNTVSTPHSSSTQATSPNTNLHLLSGIHAPLISQGPTVGIRRVAQVLPMVRNPDNQLNSSQAPTSGLNNEVRGSRDPSTNPSNDTSPAVTSQPAPTVPNNTATRTTVPNNTATRTTVPNNTATRTTIRVDDVQLRRTLRAQLLMHDLDRRINSRPLSAIQNYDWDFSGTRNPTRFHNNFLALRRDIRTLTAARNAANNQQRTNPRVDLTVRNDLGFGRPVQQQPPNPNPNVVVEHIPQLSDFDDNEPVPSTSTAPQTTGNPMQGSTPRAPAQPDVASTTPRARPSRGIDLGLNINSRPRPTIRNDSINIGGGWVMRPSIRHDTFDHRVRSALLNDEIRPRPRPRPTLRTGDLDLRVPIQPVRDQARHWNLETNSDRLREQQLRVESQAALNSAARAERVAAAAADRERAMTLDEALRECVLTAQTVTAEEVKRMQRRQAIAARQQQLAERSSLSRRNVARRVTHTVTGSSGPQRSEQTTTSPQRAETDSDLEPGPSKLRRKRQASSPSDPGCSPHTRSSGSESEPPKEAQAESELSKLRRKKPTPNGDSTISPLQKKESKPQQESKPPADSDADPGAAKLRRTKPMSSPPGDGSISRSSDSDTEPGPSKLRRKKGPTLLSALRSRRAIEEEESNRHSASTKKSPFAPERIVPGPKPQSDSKEKIPLLVKSSTDSPPTSTNSRLAPSVEPATERNDIAIPAEGLARCSTSRRPIVEGWLKNVLRDTDEESPHFKVPRIPAARRSTERRTKSQGSEKDEQQIPPEPNATPPPPEEETSNPKVFTACPKREIPFPSQENLAEPIIQPKNACLSKHYTTVRSIVHATDTELADRCGHCVYCTRVDKIRKLSNMVQNQRKPAAATNEVYDFDADREDSHENTRLYNFRQNRKVKLLEPSKDAPKEPVYLDVLPPQNPHIIEITSVPMPNQNKPMLRARLIRKTDANLENEFSLIEHENLLDQLLEIKIANSDQTAKKPAPVETEEVVAGPSSVEPTPEAAESTDDVELNYETDDSSEFLARLQTRLNTRRRSEQNTARPKEKEDKPILVKKKTDVKKTEPVKKTKAPKKNQEEAVLVEPPKKILNENLSSCFREAPVFHPTEEEFMDPLAYFEKIYPIASQFGLCKVAAPAGFKPKCGITDDVRFNVANQYISRLYCRWGAASKEMCAIKAYLADQKVFFTRPPLIEGIELNLPKLYRTVQRHGGLKKVIEKKRWGRVAEDMRFPRGPRSARRVDQLYVKHLLPYDTLSNAERRELMQTVENSWNRNYKKMLSRASNPLHRQKRLMGESESSDEVDTDEDANLAYALAEAEDCVVTGRCMKLSVFKKVASNVLCTLFPHAEQPSPKEVEEEYWTLVSGAAEHVCVNAASIDTGEEGYGFPRAKHDPYSKHPWNLKMFSQNDGNVLRSLGPVLGVTVPTLHLGMVFSTSCWHRDPHGLPWVEYMHHGPPKIWYGIPDELSSEFRKAVETLCPTSCQNKSIWLPSDITMIPPWLLREANVPLSRAVASPGEFVLVCPKAYSSSIATGYTESESVYFAPTQWLADVSDVFQELRDSCEPTMFSLSQLLLAVALDPRTPEHALAGVRANLRSLVRAELASREALMRCGVEFATPEISRLTCGQARKRPAGAWNVREQDECEVCRTTLYLSKVTGLTSKRSSLCIEHALLLIDKDRKRYERDVSGVVATIFVLRAELEDAVKRVERRLNK